MSSGDGSNDRPALGAFGYFAAIVLCCFIVGGLTYHLGGEKERRYQKPASYFQAAEVDARRACVGLEVPTMFECVYEKVEAAQEQARGEQDLSAQQKAANSALLSAIIAFATLILSGVGVWYVKRTLEATLEAVEDTSKATAAMQEANDIARKNTAISEGERFDRLRAYVHADRAKFAELEDGNLPSIFEIDWRNYGATPALKTVCIACVRVIEPNGSIGEAISDVPPLEKAYGRAVVQGRHTTAWTLPIHHQTFMNAVQGRQRIIVLSRVEYEDTIVGHRHVTQEVWEIKLTQTSPIDARGDFSVAVQEIHVPEFQIAT
jgi:hypothetical protein